MAAGGGLWRNANLGLVVADFATRYADQNERDYEAFVKAIESGRIEAREG